MSLGGKPPPPPPIQSLPSFASAQRTNICYDTQDCVWASKFPELRRACSRFRICCNAAPATYRYKHFNSLLQDGPTCGLVAMAILLDQKVLVSKLLELARDRGFSNNGELFSARRACDLLQGVLDILNFKSISIEHRRGEIFSQEIVGKLLDGFTMLVPYDSDSNHSPCLRKGHKAHWAIVTGVIITESLQGDSLDGDTVYVTVKHGKSLHLAVWKLRDLARSNQNLTEFAPKRGADDLEYVLPEGGLQGEEGLSGQFILIHPF